MAPPSRSAGSRGCRRGIRLYPTPILLIFLSISCAGLEACVSALTERDTLTRLYRLAGGKRWFTQRPGWKEGADAYDDGQRDTNTDGSPLTPVCSWFGITCRDGGMESDDVGVTEINLQGIQMKGKIPKALWAMPYLRVVNVRENSIVNGGFEGFGDTDYPSPIQKIIISENKLTDLTGIGSAQNSLEELHISSNSFEGPFPFEVFELSKLKVLLSTYNRGIVGPIPEAIGQLGNLRQMLLWYNSMTGTLPTQFGKLNKLQVLGLDENKLTGTIPTEMSDMVNLKYLSLQNSEHDAGKITGTLPSFADQVFLADLYLDGNDMTGTIPSDFLAHSNVTDKVVTVGLKDNQLSGSIPKELTIFDRLHIDLARNEITAIPNRLCKKKMWMSGEVELYGCDAILCPKGTYHKIGRQASNSAGGFCQSCWNGEDGAPFYGAEKCNRIYEDSDNELGVGDGSAELGDAGNDVGTNGDAEKAMVDSAHKTQQILVEFALSLGWKKWKDSSGWEDALEHIDKTEDTIDLVLDYCSFFGVTCFGDDSGMVTSIDLPRNNLKGLVPPHLFTLLSLGKVDLSYNKVQLDDFKSFGMLGFAKNLKSLLLDQTDITSWHNVGLATELEELSLNDVYFDSEISEEIFSLRKLKVLRCQFAGLKGELQTKIGQLTQLERLNLYGNRIDSTIPTELGLLSKLRILDLSENDFHGTIPEELNGLQKLQRLSLHQSTRDGDGLSGTLPTFDNLPNLKSIRLDSNALTGTIPSSFLGGTGDTVDNDDTDESLVISLSYNQLTGTVPPDLAEFSKVTLNLVGNKIDEINSTLCSKLDWNNGEVGRVNSCDAILCPKKTYNVYGMKVTELVNGTCESCPGADYMGSTFCDQTSVEYPEKVFLDKFYKETGGPNWARDNNWSDKGLPACQYTGVTCAGLSENDRVVDISLTEFYLAGTVPEDIWSELPSLVNLNLGSNVALKVSFENIRDAKFLKTLDVGDTGVRSLAGLEQSNSKLETILLSMLGLSGTFPHELLSDGMVHLRHIDLNYNHLSGPIPTSITKLTKLKEFDCFNCGLEGSIPSEISKLKNLETLHLPRNSLTGFLPTVLGELKNLKTLDLGGQVAGNRITGPLYPFDTNPNLVYIDLSANSLEGELPESLLLASPKDEKIILNLADNQLTGTVPMILDKFQRVDIFLANNMIIDIPDELCDGNNADWMGGLVGLRDSCDPILCPPGTYSHWGRQTMKNEVCVDCPRLITDAPYFGSTHCGGSERSALMGIYDAFGGDQWEKNRGWMTRKSICKWHGVTCSSDAPTMEERVVELSLEENNLKPVDYGDDSYSELFFQLPYLKTLNLKSNNIQLKLDHINKAENLETLILSSMPLESVAGISKAENLRELHLTDCGLNGTLRESGILDLSKLTELYISYNSFSGDVSEILALLKLKQFYAYNNELSENLSGSFNEMVNLEELVLGENYITGSIPTMPTGMKHLSLFSQKSVSKIEGLLPDFAGLTHLTTLDLEGNRLQGAIPDKFLKDSAMTDESVVIQLSNNDLTGDIPEAVFDRFSKLNLGITGNKFTSIPESLCDSDKNAWMDGYVKVFRCAAIACPPYTWSEDGRQDSESSPCQSCPYMNNAFVGNNRCIQANQERQILMELFDSALGKFWSKKNGWGMTSEVPICQWDGVQCGEGNESEEHGVIKLDLSGFQLDGDVPTSIYELPVLADLNLRYNNDAMLSFKGIEKAKNLEGMMLSDVVIDSLEGIGKAPKLRHLHMTGCDMWGPLPDELFDLSHSLKELFIAYNRFSGTIPTTIGTMKKLTDFYAYGNELTGSLPSEIGKMKKLENLVLADNRLTGQIPEEVSSMPSLQLFSISNKDENTPGLTGTLPTFKHAPQLTDLYLYGNSISGPIPQDFLSSSNNIFLVILSHNKISGTVPQELADGLPPFQMELEGNEIVSLSDSFCEKKSMMSGAVAKFGCDAILCKPGSASQFGRQNSTDSNCEPCDDAKFWGSTQCGNEFSEKKILMKFYESCIGEKWYQKSNWNDDGISICKWQGISCNDDGQVNAIRLGSNNLGGSPPPELFDLPKLRWLWLHSNPMQFSFESIGSAKELIELRLDSTELSSLEGIGAAASLEILDLRFNNIKEIPEEVLQLTQLESLSIANNEIYGRLPNNLDNLRNLKALRLGSNKIFGKLPSFEGFTRMQVLDLSQNDLSGTIPSSFMINRAGIFLHLEINLASNELTGAVPVELDKFQALTLYLRDNKFTGIPEELCDDDNSQWNSGGVGKYQCDAILCPPGKYSSLGRQRDEKTVCTNCDKSIYYGQSFCGEEKAASASSGWTVLRGKGQWFATIGMTGLIFGWIA